MAQSESPVQPAKQAVFVPLQLRSPQLVLTAAHAVPVQLLTVCVHCRLMPVPVQEQVLAAQLVWVCAEQSPAPLHVVTALSWVEPLRHEAPGHVVPVPVGVAG